MRFPVRLLVAFVVLFPAAVALLPPVTDGVQPDVSLWMTVDRATADPGDRLTYTIYIANTGPEMAPSLWVNVTMPANTMYENDTAGSHPRFVARSIISPLARFRFANVPAGNTSFELWLRVQVGAADREVLANDALLWYTNASGIPQPTRAASASTVVSIPVVTVVKQGGRFLSATSMRWTVTITNTGTGSAQNLWWNDTLPAGTEYSSFRTTTPPNRAACTPSSRWLNCTMTVAFDPASKTWEIDATIPTPLPPGTALRNWVFVNYTDADGTYLREVRDDDSLSVQTADVQAFKLADAVAVPPGGRFSYQIFYNNSGELDAREVWVNDTLPVDASLLPAVTVINANPNALIQTANTVKWQFSNVGPGVHFVTLVVEAKPSLADGIVLTNTVTVNYTTAGGAERPGTVSSATTRVSVNVPSIVASLVATPPTVAPGARVSYALFYNNTRPSLSQAVTVEVFLPADVALTSANPLYVSVANGKYTWELADVGSGEHRIDISGSVSPSVPANTLLRAFAFVNYTDDQGSRVGGSQDSVDVIVLVAGEGPPWALIGVGIAITAVVVFVAVRLYVAALQGTVIDEVFLLHRDGLLIKHYTRRLKPDVDSDVLSGMLIAVQNFVNESFIGEAGLKREGQLDEMKFGQYRILLTRGKYVIVAAVISGPRVEKVPAQIRAAISGLEAELGPVLDTWEGNMDDVVPADKYMQDLIAGKYRRGLRLPRANH